MFDNMETQKQIAQTKTTALETALLRPLLDTANPEVYTLNKLMDLYSQSKETTAFNFEEYKGSFDRVVCLGLLEFIDTIEAKALIKNFISVLKPGGKIIFTTPNFGYSMRIIETVLSKFGSVDYSNEYKFKYTQKSLRLLIDSFRFKSVVIKHFMTFAIFTSFINENFARKINNIIEKVTNHKYGLLILMEIEVE